MKQGIRSPFWSCSSMFMLLIFHQKLSACMPLSADDVFIAHYLPLTVSTDLTSEIELPQQKFIFRRFYQRLSISYPVKTITSFQPSGFKPDDLVIGLAYASNGKQPQIYSLSAIAKLSCDNDRLSIGKVQGSFLAWDRKAHRCQLSDEHHVGILDGFINDDQSHYLKQLHSKYPTCKALEQAFAQEKGSLNEVSIVQRIYRWFSQWW